MHQSKAPLKRDIPTSILKSMKNIIRNNILLFNMHQSKATLKRYIVLEGTYNYIELISLQDWKSVAHFYVGHVLQFTMLV